MDNGFISNLRQTNGDVYVKARGYASGNAPINNPYGANSSNRVAQPAQPAQPVQKTQVSVTPTKSKVTKIYDDGGVDVQTTIKEAEPYNLSNGNYGRAEYSYTHIPGKALKRSVYNAYNGKYTPSEARAVMDKDVFKNIYNNVGASLEYTDDQKAAITTLVDTILDKKYGGRKSEPEVKETVEETTEEPASTTQPVAAEASETVDYTYQPGDNFGNVLIKMGLSDGRNLWGPNGDVAYYTKQLNDQGIYGNIPIGTTIRLRRRA